MLGNIWPFRKSVPIRRCLYNNSRPFVKLGKRLNFIKAIYSLQSIFTLSYAVKRAGSILLFLFGRWGNWLREGWLTESWLSLISGGASDSSPHLFIVHHFAPNHYCRNFHLSKKKNFKKLSDLLKIPFNKPLIIYQFPEISYPSSASDKGSKWIDKNR